MTCHVTWQDNPLRVTVNHSSQSSGVERGAARVRHSRPSEGVLEFPPLRDVRKVWFSDIFSLKKSDTKRCPNRKTNLRLFDLTVRHAL